VLRGGRWFPVRPPPGGAGLVVNVGDILHILTNGAYRSVEHRVVADAARRGRTTAVVFQDASVGGLVAPLPDLLRGGAAEAARYKSIPRLEYLKVRFSALAKRTGFLESLKLSRPSLNNNPANKLVLSYRQCKLVMWYNIIPYFRFSLSRFYQRWQTKFSCTAPVS